MHAVRDGDCLWTGCAEADAAAEGVRAAIRGCKGVGSGQGGLRVAAAEEDLAGVAAGNVAERVVQRDGGVHGVEQLRAAEDVQRQRGRRGRLHGQRLAHRYRPRLIRGRGRDDVAAGQS